jgi:dienelactone hydrolase
METFDSSGTKVDVEVFKPADAGRHPAVVIAYGTRGMGSDFGPAITQFAGDLAGAGYLVLIPHYFDRTHTEPAHDLDGDFRVIVEAMQHRDTWVETLRHCLAYAAARADAVADRTGLLGFSMGGHLALRLASLGNGVKIAAVVEFFAPTTNPPFDSPGGAIEKLPPVQVHHGELDGPPDGPVSPEESRELERRLVKAGKVKGKEYEVHFYPGQRHGFKGEAAVTATKRTVDFFDTHLK